MGYLAQLGMWNPQTDTFTATLDLNDGTTLELEELQLPPPPLDVYVASQPRLAGERVTGTRHGPRTISARVVAGPLATYAALSTVMATFAAMQEAIRLSRVATQAGMTSAPRVALAIQPNGASTPRYADIQAMTVTVSEAGDPQAWVRLWQRGIALECICAPYLRGALQTLENRVTNPGFEAPSASGVNAFTDTLANFNAYAGSALAQDKTTYADTVRADSPTRYFRCDESSGTTATDAQASGNNASYVGSPTLSTTGALTGDNDKAITLNGSTQLLSVPTTGLPTGTGSITLENWIYFTSLPGATQVIHGLGSWFTANQLFYAAIDNTGKVSAGNASAGTGASAALAINTWHHIVSTWDVTDSKIRCYVDGTLLSVSPATTLGIVYGNAVFGANTSGTPGSFFAGRIDECAIYSSALSQTRVTAHYNAGVNTPSAAANTGQVPSLGRVNTGSANWGAINSWQLRWRYDASLAATFYLHYVDANNSLSAQVTGTTLSLVHRIAGVSTTLATANFTNALVPGLWYWAQLSQFPQAGTIAPGVSAVVLKDVNGALGSALLTVGPVATTDGVTALAGQVALGASGAALGFANVTLSLWGPGAWTYASAGTGVAAGAWDASNGYSGAVQSAYAARIDVARAGTLSATWTSADTSSAANVVKTAAVAAANTAYALSALLKSSGVGSSCAQSLSANEYDSTGAFLRMSTVQTVTGAQAAWTTLSGTCTTGSNCAFLALVLAANDSTTGSVNGMVWFDNCQASLASLGVMPYAELRFPLAPAQVVLTGLLGDVPAPAMVAFGMLPNGGSLAAGGTLTLYAGRRALAGYRARLVSPAYASGIDNTNQILAADTAALGGLHVSYRTVAGNYQPLFTSGLTQDYVGAYHVLSRLKMLDASPTTQNLQPDAYVLLNAWLGLAAKTDRLGLFQGPFVYPFTDSNWKLCDAGLALLPPFPIATEADGGSQYVTVSQQCTSASTGMDADWGALLPVDAEVIAANFQNNSSGISLSGWVWAYADGLSGLNAGMGSVTWSLESVNINRLISLVNENLLGNGQGYLINVFYVAQMKNLITAMVCAIIV